MLWARTVKTLQFLHDLPKRQKNIQMKTMYNNIMWANPAKERTGLHSTAKKVFYLVIGNGAVHEKPFSHHGVFFLTFGLQLWNIKQ